MVDKPLRANREERERTESHIRYYQRPKEKELEKEQVTEETEKARDSQQSDSNSNYERKNKKRMQQITELLQTLYPDISSAHTHLEGETKSTLIQEMERIKEAYASDGLYKVLEFNLALAIEDHVKAHATGVIERTIIHYRKQEGKPLPRFIY